MNVKRLKSAAAGAAVAVTLILASTACSPGCSPGKSNQDKSPSVTESVTEPESTHLNDGVTLEQAKEIAVAHALRQGDDVEGVRADYRYNRQDGDAHWHIFFYLEPYDLNVWVNRETGEIMEYYFAP